MRALNSTYTTILLLYKYIISNNFNIPPLKGIQNQNTKLLLNLRSLQVLKSPIYLIKSIVILQV